MTACMVTKYHEQRSHGRNLTDPFLASLLLVGNGYKYGTNSHGLASVHCSDTGGTVASMAIRMAMLFQPWHDTTQPMLV